MCYCSYNRTHTKKLTCRKSSIPRHEVQFTKSIQVHALQCTCICVYISCFSHFIYHEYDLWSTTISTGATLYDIPDRDPHNLLSIPYTSLSGLKTFNARTSGRLKEVTISMHLFTRKCIGQFKTKIFFMTSSM